MGIGVQLKKNEYLKHYGKQRNRRDLLNEF